MLAEEALEGAVGSLVVPYDERSAKAAASAVPVFLIVDDEESPRRNENNRGYPQHCKYDSRVGESSVEECCTHDHEHSNRDNANNGEELIAHRHGAAGTVEISPVEKEEPHWND